MINLHLRPNWSTEVSESYEFLTNIFTSRDGTEQRSAYRMSPRREVSFRSLQNGASLRAMNALLYSRGAEDICIADPARLSALTAVETAIGATVLSLTSVPWWVKNGMAIAVAESAKTHFVTIASFNRPAKTITLTTALVAAIPAGCEVRPSVIGKLQNKINSVGVTDGIESRNIVFKAQVASEFFDAGAGNLAVFGSRPVLTVGPNWQSGIEIDNETQVELVDYSRGIIKNFLPVEIPNTISQYNYAGRTAEDIGLLLNLFVAMKGRLGEFWCPSWVEDMIPKVGIAAGANRIRVEGRQIAEIFNGSEVNMAIAIRLGSGEWVFRTVNRIRVNDGTTEFGSDFNDDFDNDLDSTPTPIDVMFADTSFAEIGESVLVFDEVIVDAIPLSEIVGVYWLNLARFASDQLTVRWVTDDVAKCVAQVMTLKYQPAELVV